MNANEARRLSMKQKGLTHGQKMERIHKSL